MTHSAVFDRDFDVLGPEQTGLNGFEHHRLFRRLHHPCLISHSVSHFEASLIIVI